MKRSPMPPRRTPLRRKSLRRVTRDRAWTGAREETIARDGCCRLGKVLDGHHCADGIHVHHVRRRSQGGTDDPTNLIAVCGAGHAWIHANPAEAALFGLLELRPRKDDE